MAHAVSLNYMVHNIAGHVFVVPVGLDTLCALLLFGRLSGGSATPHRAIRPTNMRRQESECAWHVITSRSAASADAEGAVRGTFR
jgi:hypothetical protein